MLFFDLIEIVMELLVQEVIPVFVVDVEAVFQVVNANRLLSDRSTSA